jgi:hydroxycarboxylate dehydrogenase B
VPPGCLIDSEGRPTNEPKVFYGPPPGAILPFGGHKGYGLSIIADILAGALTGNGCSNPAATRLTNGMLTILLAPGFFASEADFYAETERFVSYIRGARKTSPDAEIFMPGEIEERTRAQRRAQGIELDETTWGQIVATCRTLNVPVDAVPSS